ncbi:hypothetical protein [Leptolyngbya sp. 'hensonii']|uniref:hypothetical protein n=1 Tax=Leptolyngbya sp. 'hensonii' TaxID=1922337 RepID=UPI000B047A35|nr:hypothetical protein [Leptolyngbya sp. 'hensonii']
MIICRYIRTYSLLCLWGIAVSLVIVNYQPTASTAAGEPLTYYASDTSLTVVSVLGMMSIELIVLYLMLKLWQHPRSAWGSLGALLLFIPWAMLASVFAMHGNNAVFLHALWLCSMYGHPSSR